MSLQLTYGETISGGGRLEDAATGTRQTAQYGSGVLPDLSSSFSHGTGSGSANMWYLARRTVGATTMDSLDLAGGLTAANGAAITFTKIKRVLVAIIDPNGTKVVRVGPQNVSNSWQGPWGGTGATVYREVVWKDDMVHPYAGWDVTAGTGDLLNVYNPGGAPVTYAIFIVGEV